MEWRYIVYIYRPREKHCSIKLNNDTYCENRFFAKGLENFFRIH